MEITRKNHGIKKSGWILFMGLVLGLVLYGTAMAAGTVYYVNISSGSDTISGGSQAAPWKTLHYALGWMTDGGVLNVETGVYSVANGETDAPLLVPPGVTIAGTPGAVIDGTGTGTGTGSWYNGLSISASNVEVRDITIAKFSNGSGIDINDASPAIKENIIHACYSGIMVGNTTVEAGINPLIENNLIYACTWAGIVCQSEISYPLNPLIYHNTIDGIPGTTINGIRFDGGYNTIPTTIAPEIKFNILTNISVTSQTPGDGFAIFIGDGFKVPASPAFGYNDFYGNTNNNTDNYYYNGASQQVQQTDITTDPVYVNRAGDDYHINVDSPCINKIPGSAEPATPVYTDLDGIARPQSTAWDMGCYEYYSGGNVTIGTVSWDGNSDGDGDNTSWNDPYNWNTDQVPGAGDIAVIDMDGTYAVTLGGDVTVKGIILGAPGNTGTQTLNITNNTLTITEPGSSQVEASGILTLDNGNILGAGDVKNNGTVLIYNSVSWDAGFENAAGATLRVKGTFSGYAASITFAGGFANYGIIELVHGGSYNDATLNVTSGTLVNMSGGVITTLSGDGNGVVHLNAEIDNQGTITVSGSDPLDVSKASAYHLNSGTIDAAGNMSITQSGTSPSFTNTGTIRAAAGKIFSVNGGAFESTGENIFGHLEFTDVTLKDTMIPADANLAMTRGGLDSTATLTNKGRITVFGDCVMDGAFVTVTGSTLRVEGTSGDSASITFAGGFANYGTIELVHGASYNDATLNVASGTLVNMAGGVITSLSGDGDGTVHLDSEIDNQGTITVSAPDPLDISKDSANHVNSGTIDAAGNVSITQSGTSPSFTNTGIIRAAAGKIFSVNGGAFESTGENISGHLAFADVTLKDTTIPADANLAMMRVGLDSTATLTNKGRITVSGDCAMDGAFVTVAGSTLRVEGTSGDSASITFAGGFANYGTIELVHGASYNDATLNVTSGTLVNMSGGAITTLSGDGDGLVHLNAEIDNQGIITVSGSDPLDVSKSSAHHLNSGIINVSGNLNINQSGTSPSLTNTGTMAVASGATLYVSAGSFLNNQGGIIKGNGAIDVSSPTIVRNSGIISPGMSAGKLTIIGDAVQNTDGVLQIEIGGSNTGDFDRLDISGNAAMGGTLDVSLINSYDPPVGTVFQILTYNSYNGKYGTMNLPLLSQKVWKVNRTGTFMELSVAPDIDGDGLDDNWEMQYFGNLDQNKDGDFDKDGMSNWAEYLLGTLPNNPDSDGDGYLDGEEVSMGTDPLDANSKPVYQPGEYYVDANQANFGKGTSAEPWKALHAALLRINGGATGNYILHVLDGVYGISGHEPDQPLVITQPNVIIEGEGSGSTRPVLDGTDTSQWLNGLEIQAPGAVVRNLEIKNFGTGIFVLDCSPGIEKNNIHDNQVYGINISAESAVASPKIVNNLIAFTGNGAGYPAQVGIYISAYTGDANPLIIHNTLNGGDYKGIYISESGGTAQPVIVYNIITNFAEYGIYKDSGSDLTTVAYNDLYDNGVSTGGSNNYGGVVSDRTGKDGNISKDPMYPAVYPGYDLLPGSPCIDAVPAASHTYAATDDYEGTSRPQGGAYDMGAYETAQTWHTVNFTAGTGGSVDGEATQSVIYGHDASQVRALPGTGYAFVNWTDASGTAVGTSPVFTLMNVTSDMAVTANFTLMIYNVTFAAGTGGTLSGVTSQTVTYGHDATVVTALPGTGYVFVNWTDASGAAVGTSPVFTLMNVTSDMAVTANFALRTYNVMFTAGTGGTLSGTTSQAVTHGHDATTVTALPGTGYAFVNWTSASGAAVGTTPVLTLMNVTSDMVVTANFKSTALNLPPVEPVPVSPINNVVLAEGSVTLDAGSYSDPEGDAHILTRWQVRRYDRRTLLYDTSSASDLTTYVVNDLSSGLKYAWRVGYKDAGSGTVSWSAEETFIIGKSEPDKDIPPIPPGLLMRQYRMVSFVQWLDDPSLQILVTPILGANPSVGDFKIGTYNPLSGMYDEYPDFKVRPGRSYWFLVKKGMNLRPSGVLVNTSADFYVPLDYNSATGDGWNMIAVPNNAKYLWKDVLVVVHDDAGKIIKKIPVGELTDDKTYIDRKIWRWERGAYNSDNSAIFLMKPYEGAWVNAKRKNISLCFPEKYHYTMSNPGVMFAGLSARGRQWIARTFFAPAAARADGDSPPMPMSVSGGGDVSSGGSGCFISTAGENATGGIPVAEGVAMIICLFAAAILWRLHRVRRRLVVP